MRKYEHLIKPGCIGHVRDAAKSMGLRLRIDMPKGSRRIVRLGSDHDGEQLQFFVAIRDWIEA